MTTEATTPTTDRPKKRGKAKPRDPNRVPVKRQRPAIYAVVGQLERAKAYRIKLGRRRLAFIKLEEEIALADAEIATLSKRVTALMDGTDKSETAAP